MKQYIVVENAGYEGECDIQEFATYWQALEFIRSYYEPEEQDSLHVAVATDIDGEREY